jgi:hypothetical protein
MRGGALTEIGDVCGVVLAQAMEGFAVLSPQRQGMRCAAPPRSVYAEPVALGARPATNRPATLLSKDICAFQNMQLCYLDSRKSQ